ncbi:MAG: serine/threonine-protein kinase [Gemmatimonadaceae bacterium]|nr:serine/threonine-protein kinase [Gemmatimonadaceae bacterium]
MTTTTYACPKCGTGYTPGTRFCSSCGTDVSGGVGARAASEQGATAVIERDEILPLLMEATLGEYDIYGLLGKGGMATVYLALDLALNRKVAIKVMSPQMLMGDDAIARFKREAQTAANLQHPNVIPIYAVKQTAKLVFFVMKYIEGRPLDAIIKEVGPLPTEMATTILSQVAGALQYAHKRGIVHRDIKPANIMIDEDGHAIVTDFGIAKVQEAKGLTMTGSTVGTPAYMSPEQYEGKNITGAADQYSLGVVAYEMLTGHTPFGGDSIMTIMKGHLLEAPPPITVERNDLPPSVADTVMKMLSKPIADRFEDMAAVIASMDARALPESHPVKSQLISIVKTGIMQRPQMSVPLSPMPVNKPTPRANPAVAEAAPVAPTPTPVINPVTPAPAPATPKSGNSGVIFGGIGAAVVAAGALWFFVLRPKDARAPAPAVQVAATVPVAPPPAAASVDSAAAAAAAATPPVTATPAGPTPPPAVDSKPVEPAPTKTPAKKVAAKDAKKPAAAEAAPAPEPEVDERELLRGGGAKATGTALVFGGSADGATLFVNGESKGSIGSAPRTVPVSAGVVNWSITKPGCIDARGRAEVKAGASVTISKQRATPQCE